MGVLYMIARDTVDDIKSAPQTFSSWDKCMHKSYCKWPAIIGIVVGSIIVLSILFCCVRCLCCGLECCCGCFSCFNSCCPGPRRNKRSKYADGPSSYHGYQPAPAPTYEPPKFASFDVSKKGGKTNGDALPAMPSWDNAKTHKVEDPSYDDVEMGRLDTHSQMSGGAPQTGRSGKQGYSELGSNIGTPYSENVPNYRGADTENPYDLGTQKYNPGNPDSLTQYAPTPAASAGYGSPPSGAAEPHRLHDGFQSPPQQYQPQQYQAYGSQAPTLPSYRSYAPSQSTTYEPARSEQSYGHSVISPIEEHDNRPPSLLQAGRPAAAGGGHF